jgi:hypothetical protein
MKTRGSPVYVVSKYKCAEHNQSFQQDIALSALSQQSKLLRAMDADVYLVWPIISYII